MQCNKFVYKSKSPSKEMQSIKLSVYIKISILNIKEDN